MENTVLVAIPISLAIRRNDHAACARRARILDLKEEVIVTLSRALPPCSIEGAREQRAQHIAETSWVSEARHRAKSSAEGGAEVADPRL